MKKAGLLSLSFGVALSACASTSNVRLLAAQSGKYVQSLSDGTAHFIAISSDLNAQDEARLSSMAGDTAVIGTEARQQRLAWIDGGHSDRVDVYDQVVAVTADEIIAAMTATAPTPPTIANVKGGYDDSINALAKLSVKPKSWDQFKELLDYGKAVRSTYSDLKDKAKEEAEAAASKAAAAKASGAAAAAQVGKAVSSGT